MAMSEARLHRVWHAYGKRMALRMTLGERRAEARPTGEGWGGGRGGYDLRRRCVWPTYGFAHDVRWRAVVPLKNKFRLSKLTQL